MDNLVIGIKRGEQGIKLYLHVDNENQISFSKHPQDATLMTMREAEEFYGINGLKFVYPLNDKGVCHYMAEENKKR